MTYNQVAEGIEPGECSLNYPPSFISSQFPSIIKFMHSSFPGWDNQFNAPVKKSLPKLIAVISLVSNHPLRLLFRSAAALAGNPDRAHRLLGERDLRRGRRYNPDAHRYPLAVDHNHPLRTLAPLGLPDSIAPFFAGAKDPSMKTSSHSSRPFSSSSPRITCQMSSQTCSSAQKYIRRQQVEGLGYSSGRSCQLAPVLRIQRIPSRQRRLSTQGRPPFLLLGSRGSKGSSFSHIESVKNLRRAMESSYSIIHGFAYKIKLLKNPKSGYETDSSTECYFRKVRV
jgi:hypothetical protein